MRKSMPSATPAHRKQFIMWTYLQLVFWLVGITIFLLLWIRPATGIMLFWNILIPLAPALLVIGTGFWRNICPLATTSLLPERLGLSMKKKLTSTQRVRLNLIGIILLLAIIPLRHLLFNTSGPATALILLAVAVNALIAGFIYERKSGWCAGLCPIHPVETLYGSGVAVTFINAHCSECVKCSVPCPDSTPNMAPLISSKFKDSRLIEVLIIGGFPGYVWGWFQVPDYNVSPGLAQLITSYAYPVLGMAATIILYLQLRKYLPIRHKKTIMNLFAAAAVSCYYWYRLPMLFGFSHQETNGVLVDMAGAIPAWVILLLQMVSSSFFIWWMVARKKK